MTLKVGQSGLFGRLEKYVRYFDLLELVAEPGTLPRPTRLRQWADQVPPHFVFSVVLPASVVALQSETPPAEPLDYALGAASALGADWLVLKTPSGVTPDRRKRDRLRVLAERLLSTGRKVAWEPHGPWAREQAEQFAANVGLALAIDAAQQEPPAGDVVYTRLRGIASGGRLRQGAVERAAERLIGRAQSFVILEGRGGAYHAQALRALVADEAGEEGVEVDEQDDPRLDEE